MRTLFVCINLIFSINTCADEMRITCTSDKVFNVYRVGNSVESYEEVNKLITFVSINLQKSQIKISWRNDTHDTAGEIDMNIMDVRNDGKRILGIRAESDIGYELHQFDLENLQTSWIMIEPTGDMHMLSKCFKSN